MHVDMLLNTQPNTYTYMCTCLLRKIQLVWFEVPLQISLPFCVCSKQVCSDVATAIPLHIMKNNQSNFVVLFSWGIIGKSVVNFYSAFFTSSMCVCELAKIVGCYYRLCITCMVSFWLPLTMSYCPCISVALLLPFVVWLERQC